jgi:ribonuclease I
MLGGELPSGGAEVWLLSELPPPQPARKANAGINKYLLILYMPPTACDRQAQRLSMSRS